MSETISPAEKLRKLAGVLRSLTPAHMSKMNVRDAVLCDALEIIADALDFTGDVKDEEGLSPKADG